MYSIPARSLLGPGRLAIPLHRCGPCSEAPTTASDAAQQAEERRGAKRRPNPRWRAPAGVYLHAMTDTWIDIPAGTPEELSALVGAYDEHLRAVERAFDLKVVVREEGLRVQGQRDGSEGAAAALRRLQAVVHQVGQVSALDVRQAIESAGDEVSTPELDAWRSQVLVRTARGQDVRPKTAGQARYVQAMRTHVLTFCTGPAGTGKTYLAMAMAVAALRDRKVGRIVLTRPILEAGERLGYLPGDLQEKVDPYLRPLHDALYDLVGPEGFERHVKRGMVEVAPLAYMRGRTLNDAFVVLDEGQNTTTRQMKMLLTRMGYSATVVVTGDTTQVDLPETETSGLVEATGLLQGIRNIAFCALTGRDIVRHDLVQRIVEAYGRAGSSGRQSGPSG